MGSQAIAQESLRTLHISIGQVPLSLSILGSTLHEKALARYHEFAFKLQEQDDQQSQFDSMPVVLRPSFLSGDRATSSGADFSYVLDDASLVLDAAGAEFHGVRHEYALDSLLRILLTMLLLPRQGFLLHAATVVRDGRAYVFAGRSGAGKSTVASLSPAGSVLTDEISLLRFIDGGWHAYGTPFWGEFKAAGQNEHYPIAGVYSLVQSPEHRREKMATQDILRALLPCVLFFSSNTDANEALLSLLLGIVRQVGCHRLHFCRDDGFWQVIAP